MGFLYELDMNPCIYIESEKATGDQAVVKLREQFYDPCTRISVQNLPFDFIQMKLQLEGGEWKIVSADRYFANCWTGASSCD